ncbi:HNH endonuclease family protein [Haloferax gibbonsii]|uniref:HNH endonuclease family protein n=1 Tax=Haloferax gibbonsii TaxID=35746 RepID=UPI0030B84E8A
MSSSLLGINQKITKSKLYEPTFTDTIDDTGDIESLLKDIRQRSDLFRKLLQQDIDRFSSSENSEINRLLRDAEIVSITPFTLFLRAFSESDDVNFLKEVIRKSTALLVRRQICDRNTGPHDTIFNHLAQNAFESEDPLQYVDEYLQSEGRLPNDEQFKRHFAQEDFSRSDRTKYILSKIEEDHFGHGGKEVVESRYQVHIEHILPERPGKNLTKLWLEPFGISDDEHDDFKKKIGNLTLLEEDPNISASNRSLDKKQEYYTEGETDFQMTHELLEQERWGVGEIEQRSERLARIAADVWNL